MGEKVKASGSGGSHDRAPCWRAVSLFSVLTLLFVGTPIVSAAGAQVVLTNTSLAGEFAVAGSGAAFWVDEERQGGRDFNGDGDTGDFVLHVLGPDGSVHNIGLGAEGTRFARSRGPGETVAFSVGERAQGYTDLNGDGDSSDDVLHVFSWERGVRNLGLAGENYYGLGVDSGRVLLRVAEAEQGMTDFNGDGDSDDLVVHLYRPDSGVLNLGLPGVGSLFESGAAVLVSEYMHGETDLNGDGDVEDEVWHVYTDDGAGTANLELAGNHGYGYDAIGRAGDGFGFLVSEEDQGGTDLNGDGDSGDWVLHVYEPASGVSNLGLDSYVVGSIDGGFLAMVGEGWSVGTDLNGDGDIEDWVFHTYTPTQGATNLGLARAYGYDCDSYVGPWGCGVDGFEGGIAFLVSEEGHGNTDLNGDSDDNDRVMHVLVDGVITNLALAHGRPRWPPTDQESMGPVGNGIAFRVSEIGQGNTDLNGDGDADDYVAHVHYPETGTVNVERDGGQFTGMRSGFLLCVYEEGEGSDLNGDGDVEDFVLHHYQASSGVVTNVGVAGCSQSADATSAALVEVHEAGQGGTDLNGDGDTDDVVLHTFREGPFVPTIGIITGTVTDSVTGEPLVDVCVEVYHEATPTLVGQAATVADGVYYTPGLAEGRYKLKFFQCQPGVYGPQWYGGADSFEAATPVEVVDGAVADGVDIDLDIVVLCGGERPTIVGTNDDEIILGTRGHDVIVGLGGDDTIRGRSGNDTICGNSGDDSLVGSGGRDRLIGGKGNDTLIPGAGDDSLNGGSGIDKAAFAGSKSAVRVDLAKGTASGQGADTIAKVEDIVGSDHDDVLVGNKRSNAITGGAGNDVLIGRGGSDKLSGGKGADVAKGGAGKDTLTGGSGDDVLIGGGGGDVLKGGAQRDLVYPGSGDDRALGQAGTDAVSYADVKGGVTANLQDGTATGAGSDVIEGFEWLEGTRSGDSLTGTASNNRIFGRGGPDTINGGKGKDLLFGDQGRDTLIGGGGKDTMVGGPGDDILDGGSGDDTASYWESDGVTVNLSSGVATGDGTDALTSIEWIVGSPSGDTLIGNAGSNLIEGRAGADTIRGGSATDWLVGFEGNDTIYGDAGDDYLYGDQGTDTLNGGTGTDRCFDGENHYSCEYRGTADLPKRTAATEPLPTWTIRLQPAEARGEGDRVFPDCNPIATTPT